MALVYVTAKRSPFGPIPRIRSQFATYRHQRPTKARRRVWRFSASVLSP
jgi:hypothetical protein